ncbi:MAG: DUF4058 family protein [Oscillatoriaceae cyanobacterium Prado104]|jgi:hypothetical protein|nr:DUF4058 family protein [Oscillatoriaceae cyanobacterium Prado104]
MPNPFAGMNPYLEQPEYWSDFHNQLVAAIARSLVPKLVPKYRVVTDKWVYKIAGSTAIAIGRPDISVQQNRRSNAPANTNPLEGTVAVCPLPEPVKVTVPMLEEIQQSYIEVKDAATQQVVTAIEVLSPANKSGDGRKKYTAKRQNILESLTNLVEIDLLREGIPLPVETGDVQSHYRILISPSQTRPISDMYPFNLGDRIPAFLLPLRSEDSEPILDLQSLVDELYEQLGYDYFIDYNSNPPSPWLRSEITEVLSIDRRSLDRL